LTLHAELCRRAAWVLGQAILTCIGLVLVLLPVNTHASTPLKLRIVGGLAGVDGFGAHAVIFVISHNCPLLHATAQIIQ